MEVIFRLSSVEVEFSVFRECLQPNYQAIDAAKINQCYTSITRYLVFFYTTRESHPTCKERNLGPRWILQESHVMNVPYG
jgi:hypothetical protein